MLVSACVAPTALWFVFDICLVCTRIRHTTTCCCPHTLFRYEAATNPRRTWGHMFIRGTDGRKTKKKIPIDFCGLRYKLAEFGRQRLERTGKRHDVGSACIQLAAFFSFKLSIFFGRDVFRDLFHPEATASDNGPPSLRVYSYSSLPLLSFLSPLAP
jgi:hypothetical protein